jgi:hypothetical protein
MTINEKTLLPISVVVSIIVVVVSITLTYTRNEVDHARMAVKIEENTKSIDKLTAALQRLHPSLSVNK